MGRIVIHIGTHKTGTTSIQKTLAKNRRALLRDGIFYPDYTIIGGGRHYAHIGMANALAGKYPKFSVEQAQAFFSRVREMSEGHPTTLLSAEPLYRQVLAKRAPQDMKSVNEYWNARDQFIAQFRSLIGPAEIVIVVRRQDDFAESMYQEQVKVTRYAENFAAFLKKFWFHFDYAAQVDAWKKHFETVRIVPFETLKGADITQRFLSAADIRTNAIVDEPMQNVAMPHDGVILKREANAMPGPREQLDQLSEVLLGEAFREATPSEPRSFFASEAARAQFFADFDDVNARLAGMAGIPVEAFFGPPKLDGIVYGDTIAEEARQRLLAVVQAANAELAQQSGIASPDGALSVPVLLPQPASGLSKVQPMSDFNCPLESCRLDYTAGGSTLVISFDNAGVPHRKPADRRPWGHKFLTGEGHAVLGVIAGSSDWYRGRDLHRALLDLRDQGFFRNFRQVVLMGSSMGGYGATAFASLALGSRVISFNPQSTLRRDLVPWDNQHANGMKQDWSGLFSDGAAEIGQSAAVHIFYDPFNSFDRRHAERYAGSNVHFLRAPFLGHGLPDAYQEMGLLKEIMRRGIAGTLTEDWYYPAIRKRRALSRYYKHIAKPLGETGRARAGQHLMRRAFERFEDPFFCTREAVFTAAQGDLPAAVAILEEGDHTRRSQRRKKAKETER